jgi:hypothetical protein
MALRRPGANELGRAISHQPRRPRRAYELIAIADGRTTVEKVRKEKKEQVRRVRGKFPPRSGKPNPTPTPRVPTVPWATERHRWCVCDRRRLLGRYVTAKTHGRPG